LVSHSFAPVPLGSSSDFIFLLPCTLRAVKDPFYLAATFERWHRERSDVHLVIVGSLVDAAYEGLARRYASKVWTREGSSTAAASIVEPLSAGIPAKSPAASPLPPPPDSACTGVTWCDSLAESTEFLPSLRCASALVNSSLSEGMSGAILEAMSLRIPVLARANEGNLSIVREGATGWVFEGAEECRQKAEKVVREWRPISTMGDPAETAAASSHSASSGAKSSAASRSVPEIVAAAKAYVDSEHSVEAEIASYAHLIRDLHEPGPSA
jgi:glycosyltransferase involved in cell wall biosynthesis